MSQTWKLRQSRISTGRSSGYLTFIAGTLVVVSSLGYGCSRNAPSQTPGAQAPAATQNTTKAAPSAAPTLNEVNQAVARVFRDAATIDPKHEPNFFAGDFNGDASQDIAVIIQPAPGKLPEMNQEFPPWILKDPFTMAKPGTPPMSVGANEILLAIIHGYGPNGWHDPQATQTYLLKNAVGSGARFEPKSAFLAFGQGKKLPRVAGDLISENLQGSSGYLYFTGGQYSWYDPKTFAGDAPTRLVHPGVTVKNKIDLLHPKLVPAEK